MLLVCKVYQLCAVFVRRCQILGSSRKNIVVFSELLCSICKVSTVVCRFVKNVKSADFLLLRLSSFCWNEILYILNLLALRWTWIRQFLWKQKRKRIKRIIFVLFTILLSPIGMFWYINWKGMYTYIYHHTLSHNLQRKKLGTIGEQNKNIMVPWGDVSY